MDKDRLMFRFLDFVLIPEASELRQGEDLVEMEPQVFRMLCHLIENRDRVISKDELIETIWDGRIVSDATLNSRVNSLRRAVGDDGKSQSIIRTFAKRGYRFVAELQDAGDQPPPVAHAGGGMDIPSIAVLPFDNRSGDPEQEYFSDGITEDMITALARLGWLRVAARNSAFSYKGDSPDIRDVARELGVRYVLEGSVRKVANRVRITAQLVDGHTGNDLWADRYDRELEDIFSVQDEITETVIGEIQPEVSKAEIERARAKHPDSLDAWDLYQRGMNFWYRHGREDVETAVVLFRQSIDLAASSTATHSALSFALSVLLRNGYSQELDDAAVSAAGRAIELDGNDANGYVALGLALTGRAANTDGDFNEAISALEQGVALNPNLVQAHSYLGRCLADVGRAAEAVEHLLTAIQLSPRDLNLGGTMASLGVACFANSDFEATLEWTSKAKRVLLWMGFSVRVAALAHLGRVADARTELGELFERYPDLPRYLADHRAAFHDDLIEGLGKAGLKKN
jgi:TolB-like protein